MAYLNPANGLLQPLGIDLEREALGVFGDYVDNQNRIDSFKALGLSDAEARDLAALTKPGEFNVRPASGANNQIAPKQKFLFQVEFEINPDVLKEILPQVNPLTLHKFGFFVKQIDRPKVEYTYEDVNMYNYRTRVLTKVTHQSLSMNMWDDARNTVGEFINIYRKAYTPSARQEMHYGSPETSGFNFVPGVLGAHSRDYASRGTLTGNAKTFLSKVTVKQIYSTHTPNQKSPFSMCIYTFFNPVLKTFDFDDVNHETSESNGISMVFDYDTLHIEDYEVSSIQRDSELPDYYNFIPGKPITDNLLSMKGAGAAKTGEIIPRQGMNWLDEAKRAIMSGNPMSYVMERGKDVFRNGTGDANGFRGVRGVVDDVTGLNRTGNPKPINPDYPGGAFGD